MDANTMLLWLTGSMCLALIGRGVLGRNRALISWTVVAAFVASATLVSYFQKPEIAGFVGGALCALFLLVPMYARAWAYRFVGKKRFAPARILLQIAIALHPTRSMRGSLAYLDTLEHPQRALETRGPLHGPNTAVGRYAQLQALRAAGDWSELLTFTRALPPEVVESEPLTALLLVRALVESSELESALVSYARFERLPALASVRAPMRLVLAVRLGRLDLVDRILEAEAGADGLEPGMRAYLRAAALQAARAPEAESALQAVAQHLDPEAQRLARERLAKPLAPIAIAELSPRAQAIADDLAREVESAAGFETRNPRAPATLFLLVVIAAVYLLEELLGGSTNSETLIDLGALVIPRMAGADNPLRVLSAAFLHLGSMHVLMNSLGLWTLGRRVEAMIGSWRTLCVFLASALIGNLGALALLHGPTLLVGASGGVLGLLGALLAVAVRRHFAQRTRFLRRQLQEIGFVLLLQAVFDFSTPQVSSTVHAIGLIAGFATTLALAWQRAREG